jgi:glutamine synthetase
MDMSPADGDVLVMPDPDSFTQLPWKKEVAWLACDPFHAGHEIDQAPRNVLRKQRARLLEQGQIFKTGVELEFFLLDKSATAGGAAGMALLDSADDALKPCYDQNALMRQYDFIAELLAAMEELGWKPYQADHEDGNGQFEVNWEYDECLATADRVAFSKVTQTPSWPRSWANFSLL